MLFWFGTKLKNYIVTKYISRKLSFTLVFTDGVLYLEQILVYKLNSYQQVYYFSRFFHIEIVNTRFFVKY